MALKYYIDYTNISNDDIRVEIHQDSFVGESLSVKGKATLNQASVKSVLSPLRGMGLSLDLEANKDLDFTDLYSEKETEFKVYLYRNEQMLFAGFIKPEGLWQDFVKDKWIITLECIDGLGVLKNMRFLDENNEPFEGLIEEYDVIYYCLYRTSLELPINVRIDLNAVGQDNEELSILSKIRLNAGRFYKYSDGDSDVEIMDCEEVLKSTLEKYNAVIQQYNGEWYIFRPMDIFNTDSINDADLSKNTFYRYKPKNISTTEIVTKNKVTTRRLLGSNIDNYFPHHANANQRISVRGAVSAFRVKFDYGVVQSLVGNTRLLPVGGGWDKNSIAESNYMTINGVEWLYDTPIITQYEYSLNQSFLIEEDDSVAILIDAIASGYYGQFRIKVKLSNGTDVRWLSGGATPGSGGADAIADYAWNINDSIAFFGQSERKEIICDEGQQDERREVYFGADGMEREYKITTPPAPFDGSVEISLFSPVKFIPNATNSCANIGPHSFAKIFGVKIQADVGDKQYEGEVHTAYRTPAVSSDVEDSFEVFNGDIGTDVYYGAMKLLNGDNTTFWYRTGQLEREELLRIMVEDRLRIQSKTQKIFSGDVFGYMPSLSVIEINNLQGKFFPIEFNWDSKLDLCSFTLMEYFNENLTSSEESGEDILYEKTYSRGNVIKPTIEG